MQHLDRAGELFSRCGAKLHLDQGAGEDVRSSPQHAPPGVSVTPLPNLADHVAFGQEFFEGVRVPAENVIGEPNNGWQQRGSAPHITLDTCGATKLDQVHSDRILWLHKQRAMADSLPAHAPAWRGQAQSGSPG